MTSDSADPRAVRTILVITPWKRRWELGGGAGLADDFHFIHGLTANGWRVRYVSPRDAAPPDVTVDGYAVHAFFNVFEATERWPVWLRRAVGPIAFTMLATVCALRLARREKPDVVLGQTHLPSLAVFIAGMVCGVPSAMKLFGVENLSGDDSSRARQAGRNAEMIAALKIPHDLWLVLDDGTRGDAALRRHGVPSEKIRFLSNGVDLSWGVRRGDGASFRRALTIPEDACVLFWLARLVEWKRADDAFHALARALPRVSRPLVLVVGGEGPERARLETLARSLGVSGSVRFAGAIAHDRVPDAMAAAALFLATSERSNKSVATCEAMLCGVPVVAFDAGGTGDVVRDGETGRLVADGDVAALADAVAALAADDGARAALGAGARAFARARFTGWERRVEMERELLERLAASGGR
ncbi:MAG TPA: glycosyltransferase family 4 protein [Candidatus Krumholzibacteria bacterium]|nr:glycosyltransferase family 4 protein [Candidatus Krumholzibacteria bacterium]